MSGSQSQNRWELMASVGARGLGIRFIHATSFGHGGVMEKILKFSGYTLCIPQMKG